jgi:hypothetical protein
MEFHDGKSLQGNPFVRVQKRMARKLPAPQLYGDDIPHLDLLSTARLGVQMLCDVREGQLRA